MTWLKWIVLGIASIWVLTTNLNLREHYKTSSEPALGANMQAMLQTLSVICVLALHKSPFHLLWLIPLTYLICLIFNPYRSKVVAFLPWLYGYLLAYTVPANW